MSMNILNSLLGPSAYAQQSYRQPPLAYGGYEQQDPLSALLAVFGNQADSYDGGLQVYGPDAYGDDPYAMCAPPPPKCAKKDDDGDIVKLLLKLILTLLKDDNKCGKSCNKQEKQSYQRNNDYNNDYSNQYDDQSYDNNDYNGEDAISTDYLDQLFGDSNPYANMGAGSSSYVNAEEGDPFSDSNDEFVV